MCRKLDYFSWPITKDKTTMNLVYVLQCTCVYSHKFQAILHLWQTRQFACSWSMQEKKSWTTLAGQYTKHHASNSCCFAQKSQVEIWQLKAEKQRVHVGIFLSTSHVLCLHRRAIPFGQGSVEHITHVRQEYRHENKTWCGCGCRVTFRLIGSCPDNGVTC